MNDRLVTPPETEPVSVLDLKAHLRVTNDAEDSLLMSYIEAARQHVEGQTGRSLAVQSREASFDGFPSDGVLRLNLSPLISVQSVKYIATDGTETTIAPTAYIVNTRSEPGTIQPAIGTAWPTPAAILDSVRVAYTCGTEAAPAVLKQAVIFLAAHWYEQRLPVNVGNIINEMPYSLAALLWSNRVIGR